MEVDRLAEYRVYLALVDFLQNDAWTIVCACPPFGTDARFRKCLFPRRELGGSDRGPRDEVDVIAHGHGLLLLVECKPHLSESLSLLNNLGESDYAKLRRIAADSTVERLCYLLRRGTGVDIPNLEGVGLALAVEVVDEAPPDDMTVVRAAADVRLWVAAPLNGHWRDD